MTESADTPLLEIEDLCISYSTRAGEVPAVIDFSLAMNAGESVGLVGESGCGKSTVAMGIMRIVRGLVLDLRNRDYVAAAQTRGESAWRIMLIEILPNARGPLIVDACLRLGYVIITIGVLGFLGLGLPPPDPDWGSMINEARAIALAFPHMTVFPCLAISSLILGFNLLADGLREISLRD